MPPVLPHRQESESERYRIRSIDRALSLLSSFLEHDSDLSISDIGRANHLDPSTAFRILVTLEARGFVEHDPVTRKYRLGVACLKLGSRFLNGNDIRKRARDVMKLLRDEFGETVHLAVLDRTEIVYLEKLDGLHPIGLMSSQVGGRAPLHSTGVGKAILAFLPGGELDKLLLRGELKRRTNSTITEVNAMKAELVRIRARGYALDQQENEIGVGCIAVPIFVHRAIAASMSISGPVDRIDGLLKRPHFIERVRTAAKEISVQFESGSALSDQHTLDPVVYESQSRLVRP